ncbi:MAG: TatD family hydrolase [bacterium]|nr:TatD family hydrolase [bacterium]
MLLDYHAHVNFNAYKEDADVVIKRALEASVFMVLVGSQIDTSRRAVEIAERYPRGVWAAVGLHPVHLEQMEIDEEEDHFATRAEIFDKEAYRALAVHPKVVAIGEFGIDYYHIADLQTPPSPRGLRSLSPSSTPSTRGGKIVSPPLGGGVRGGLDWIAQVKNRQNVTFRAQLDLADELDLPLILHCRGSVAQPTDAYKDMLAILGEYVKAGKLKRGGSIHCFTSTLPIALQYVALGFHVGFTGVITFKNAERYGEVIRGLPLERILVETDCPYLTPAPHRGKRNEPLYVRYVAEKIAEIKGMDKEAVETQLFENTLRVFNKIKM